MPLVYPGSSLHDELALLVESGLTTADALRAATLWPAEFLGLQDRIGTVAPGRRADLLLLDADPLADIDNTRRIRAVVLDGRLLQRADLDALLDDAAVRPDRADRGAASSDGPSRPRRGAAVDSQLECTTKDGP